MGNVTNLNNPTMLVVEGLDAAKQEAEEVEAQSAIVILVNPDDDVTIVTSHSYTFASFAGYLMTAYQKGILRELLNAGDDGA